MEDATPWRTLKQVNIPMTCFNCLETGEVAFAPFLRIPCPLCNGSGYIKNCKCGSGLHIGFNEDFCTMCKPGSLIGFLFNELS